MTSTAQSFIPQLHQTFLFNLLITNILSPAFCCYSIIVPQTLPSPVPTPALGSKKWNSLLLSVLILFPHTTFLLFFFFPLYHLLPLNTSIMKYLSAAVPRALDIFQNQKAGLTRVVLWVGGEERSIQNLQIPVLNLPGIQEISQHKATPVAKFRTRCHDILTKEKKTWWHWLALNPKIVF